MSPPHPLDGLSTEEAKVARQHVIALHPDSLLNFKEVFLHEPRKKDLVAFLALEHAGKVDDKTQRPDRQAMCFYDVIGADKIPKYHETIIDITVGKVVSTINIDSKQHAALTL